VKAPYTATIKVPAPLVALMSALSVSHAPAGDHIAYSFKQDIPIPV
jgi:hypothetical protein